MPTATQLNEQHYRIMGEREAQLFIQRLDASKQVPKDKWGTELILAHLKMTGIGDPNHKRPQAFHQAFLEKGQLLLKQYGAN